MVFDYGSPYTASNSTSTIWTTWNDSSDTTASTPWVTDDPWNSWNYGTATSATSSDCIAWMKWAEQAYLFPKYAIKPEVSKETETEKAARLVEAERQREISMARVAQRQAQKRAAKERAEEFLLENLTEEQCDQYQKHQAFHVVGEDGKRYEVDCTKRQHNVFELSGQGERIKEYCLYQQGGTPQGDNLLAQKLLLETNFERFRNVANATRIPSGPASRQLRESRLG